MFSELVTEKRCRVLAILLALGLGASSAKAFTCFCKVSADNLTGVCHPAQSQILLDLTGAVGLQFNPPRTTTKWQQCSQRCSVEAQKATAAVAAAACAAGVPNGQVVQAYAALGNCGNKGEYAAVHTFGPLINTPPVTQTSCTCPTGWAANAPKCTTKVSNVAGGHYPTQTCAQSKAAFEAGALTNGHLASACPSGAQLIGVSDISCKDTPIPGFPTPGGSVYSATVCCGTPGVTTDGRCKKIACQPDTVMPYPTDGTTVGTAPPPFGTSPTSWGFSWENAFYAWGTAANGGAPTDCKTETIKSGECRFP